LIISIGKANKPTPPKITTKIHPKKERMAITYTARETSRVIEVFEIFGENTGETPVLPTSRDTY